MGLNPSPVEINRLQGTMHEIPVLRYDLDDPTCFDRSIMIGNDDMADGTGRGVPLNAIEIASQEELYDLAQALLDQVQWLSGNEDASTTIETKPETCDWVVTRCVVQGDESQRIETIGPMTREACTPEWWDTDDVLWVTRTQLTRPPLV